MRYKFRAWDKIDKRYLEWQPLDGLQDFGSLWNLLDGGLDRYRVEQFTGLKDKNGKEIYEGDVVRYNGKLYSIRYRVNYCDYVLFIDSHDWKGIKLYKAITKKIEIIGNIHQDSHLLK
jgi:uncharacterized phage protein (TIGR01671 family)